MSDSPNQDDPWAKWRKPEANTAVDAEKPANIAPVKKTVAPVAGTLSVGKKPYSAPAPRVMPKKPAERAATVKGPAPVASNTADGVRLSKVMSERGMCSRREADLWIERGWVLVNGERISELGSRIDPQAEIAISKDAARDQAKQVTILLNKPVGYVSGQPEPNCTPAVKLILAESQVKQSGDPEFKPWMLRGLAPAGRLDIDSTGLLVMTQDGRVAKKLIGEDSGVEKEYLVRVSGEMIPNGLALLKHGLELDGKPLKQAWVKQLNEDQLHFILREGKKRQIRRMCELVGLTVIGLKRVRIGRVMLGDLQQGQWRFLRANESF
jgi:23S rRNA pseudouridine2604 synthase